MEQWNVQQMANMISFCLAFEIVSEEIPCAVSCARGKDSRDVIFLQADSNVHALPLVQELWHVGKSSMGSSPMCVVYTYAIAYNADILLHKYCWKMCTFYGGNAVQGN